MKKRCSTCNYTATTRGNYCPRCTGRLKEVSDNKVVEKGVQEEQKDGEEDRKPEWKREWRAAQEKVKEIRNTEGVEIEISLNSSHAELISAIEEVL